MPSCTFTQNVATSGAWEALLPRLVYPLMEQERARREMNVNPSEREPPAAPQCSCMQREAKVLVVSFTCMCSPSYFYKDGLKGAYG
jgi:hypothetical protein